MRDIDLDPVLALVMIVRVAEVGWDACEDQKWFLHNYKDVPFVNLPAIASIGCCSPSGVEVAEGARAELQPRYHFEYKDRGMTL